MSKKSKRHYRDTTTNRAPGSTASMINQKSGEFDPDYTDVIKDLKRIAYWRGASLRC
jgi:hypothetical protein